MSQPCKGLVLRVGLNQLIRSGWIWCLGRNAHQPAICQKTGAECPWSGAETDVLECEVQEHQLMSDKMLKMCVQHAPRAKAVDCNRHSGEAEPLQRILTLKSVTFSFSPSCPNFTLVPLSPRAGVCLHSKVSGLSDAVFRRERGEALLEC